MGKKKNKADISQPLQGKANISFVIHPTDAEETSATNDVHWTPRSQELMRQFQAMCALRFGQRKCSRVLDALAQAWLDGEVRVTI